MSCGRWLLLIPAFRFRLHFSSLDLRFRPLGFAFRFVSCQPLSGSLRASCIVQASVVQFTLRRNPAPLPLHSSQHTPSTAVHRHLHRSVSAEDCCALGHEPHKATEPFLVDQCADEGLEMADLLV